MTTKITADQAAAAKKLLDDYKDQQAKAAEEAAARKKVATDIAVQQFVALPLFDDYVRRQYEKDCKAGLWGKPPAWEDIRGYYSRTLPYHIDHLVAMFQLALPDIIDRLTKDPA